MMSSYRCDLAAALCFGLFEIVPGFFVLPTEGNEVKVFCEPASFFEQVAVFKGVRFTTPSRLSLVGFGRFAFEPLRRITPNRCGPVILDDTIRFTMGGART